MQLEIGFDDAQGRRVELRVQEDADDKRGFPMLAPVGADGDKPKQLFLVQMPSIDLVRRRGSLFEGRIGDRALGPSTLPVPLRGHAVWFARYVQRPVIGNLEPTGLDQRVKVELDVTRPWVPANMPWAMTIFVWLVPSLRNWPATYRWRGVIEYGVTTSLQGSWIRK